MSQQVEQSPEVVPTGNTYDKYGSQNPVVKKLMENERFAYGFVSQAAGMVGGLYELGEMGVKGAAKAISDPVGTAAHIPSSS